MTPKTKKRLTEAQYAKLQKKAQQVLKVKLEDELEQQRANREGGVVYSSQHGVIHELAFADLGDDEKDKFQKALDNGPAVAQGAVGIKKLDGQKDRYELKILGAGGGARIYGDKRDDGLIHFTRYSAKH